MNAPPRILRLNFGGHMNKWDIKELFSPHTQSPEGAGLSAVERKGFSDITAQRFELKYRISEAKAQAVKNYVRHYLPMDRYAAAHPDGQYPIASLYFDSEDFELCKETLLNKPNRFKLRIRSYSDEISQPVFFEIKRRVNRVIAKRRARVPRKYLPEIFSCHTLPPLHNKKDEEYLRQFLFYNHLIQGRPVTLLRYLREPFEGQTQNRVRITFDRHLCCRDMDQPQVMLNGSGWRQIPLDFVILEIKFTDGYPSWLHEMIQIFNLNLSSMSKYVTSIKGSERAGIYNPVLNYLE